MATPSIELNSLLGAIKQISNTFAVDLWNDFQKQKADGTPTSTIIQRYKEQTVLNQPLSPVISTSNQLAKETTNKMRNIYHTLQQDWSSGLSAMKADPANYQFLSRVGNNSLTTQQAGYTVRLDDLGRKIVTLSEESGTAYKDLDILEEQIRKSKRVERLSAEELNTVGNKSRETKKNVMLLWVATFVNTCKGCQKQHGKMKTKLQWEQGGILPGSGKTECGNYCQCHLYPSRNLKIRFGLDEETNDSSLQQEFKRRTGLGISLQKQRIKEMALKRGKKYSEEYTTQMLGQIQSQRFNPYLATASRSNLYLRKFPKSGVTKTFKETVTVRSS